MKCPTCGVDAGTGVVCPSCGGPVAGALHAEDAAASYSEQARVLAERGDRHAGLEALDCAIDLYRCLTRGGARRNLHPALAAACHAKADLLSALGDPRTAAVLYAQAAEMLEPLVSREGRRDLEGRLALAWGELAWATWELYQDPGVLVLLDRAIAVWRRHVERDGRTEPADALEIALARRARIAEFV